jgi:hypothetical protein
VAQVSALGRVDHPLTGGNEQRPSLLTDRLRRQKTNFFGPAGSMRRTDRADRAHPIHPRPNLRPKSHPRHKRWTLKHRRTLRLADRPAARVDRPSPLPPRYAHLQGKNTKGFKQISQIKDIGLGSTYRRRPHPESAAGNHGRCQTGQEAPL